MTGTHARCQYIFFSGEEFEVLIELRYGRWWWEESQSERVSEWVIVASVSRYWVSLLCRGRRKSVWRAAGVHRHRDVNLSVVHDLINKMCAHYDETKFYSVCELGF
jgi:hypothetical protein